MYYRLKLPFEPPPVSDQGLPQALPETAGFRVFSYFFRPFPDSGESGKGAGKKPGKRGNRESDFLSATVTRINCSGLCTGLRVGIYSTASIMPTAAVVRSHWQAACGSYSPGVRDSEREHAAVSASGDSEHQAQWTQHILSREFHALTGLGSMRLQ